ncbi:MAG: iron dicitrate transport regulator FecR [Planctomycetota bacterium]
MSDDRFQECLERLIDDEPSDAVMADLIRLCNEAPSRLQEVRDQLRLVDLLSQYEAELRSEDRFVASLHQRVLADQSGNEFVQRVAEVASSSMGKSDSRDCAQRPPSRELGRRSYRIAWMVLASMATMILMGFFLQRPRTIAKITSNEGAAWESHLPTIEGARLRPGLLRLRSGLATIEFDSGASVVLEAPSDFELVSAMKARLTSGVAVFDVPDSAIGFMVETPEGYAIDYGTRFAVTVESNHAQSAFELIEGEIAVHHERSGNNARLVESGQAITITDQRMVTGDPENDDDVRFSQSIRVGTNGQATSVLRSSKRHQKWHSGPRSRELLTAKRTESGEYDHYSLMKFDLEGVPLADVARAGLRLNLVPSSKGLSARLPRVSRFGVYGLVGLSDNWQNGVTWDEAPGPQDGVLLGTFEVPRSQNRGSFLMADQELLHFLRSHAAHPVTLVLARQTTQIEGIGPGLTHMFAGDAHPQSVGPALEFWLQDPMKESQ